MEGFDFETHRTQIEDSILEKALLHRLHSFIKEFSGIEVVEVTSSLSFLQFLIKVKGEFRKLPAFATYRVSEMPVFMGQDILTYYELQYENFTCEGLEDQEPVREMDEDLRALYMPTSEEDLDDWIITMERLKDHLDYVQNYITI